MTQSNYTVLTDSFLQEIAAIYTDEVRGATKYRRRPKPAKVLSEQYGKPLATVNRWIRKARNAEMLAAAAKGKATA